MPNGVDIKLTQDTGRLNRILKHLPSNRDDLVREVAFEVQIRAQEKAPIDTGALANSIYVRTSKGEGMPVLPPEKYSSKQGRSVKLGQRVELPRVKPGEAAVGPSMEYGLYVEFGTKHMKAQPYLGPALRAVASRLEHDFKDELEHVVTDG